ncbi:MAG: MATE family efflux transporter [Clostridia bacterium]|nr:MATE family efflux transporter [Clostridia bacterium]
MQRDIQTRRTFKEKFIGDRAFYALVVSIVLPIIIQNTFTNFVSLLDNIMVGRIGTEQMSGVSISNQLLFVFNLCIFGSVAGAGIFAAQFHGAGNHQGVQHCFRFKLYSSFVLVGIALFLFLTFDEKLIGLYLNEADTPEQLELTLKCSLEYLHIMLFGLFPFAITQAYAGTLRETGETSMPMRASVTAVLVNLVFNYLLIFGKFGFPELGVRGAAIATVISRFVEMGIVIFFTHRHSSSHRFIKGAYRSGYIPGALTKDIFIKGTPLLFNEFLWSMGMAALTQCYSMRGLNVVAAQNISSTVSNLFNVVCLSMGNATAIILGQTLGSGKTELAHDQCWKLLATSLFSSVATSIVLIICSPFVPMVYNTSEAVRVLASRFLVISSVAMPLFTISFFCYFVLRAGGKAISAFILDSAFTWVVCLPIAWCLVHLTDLGILSVYLIIQLSEIIKSSLGLYLVKRGTWLNNMVA